MSEDRSDVEPQRERIMDGFRDYGRAFAELGRSFAASLGLHTTDALALIEVISAEDRGTPLSQAQLSQRIGLTAGATSSLLNRLEGRGHITRSRVHRDRRVVTLRAAGEVHQAADDFFAPLGLQLDAMAATYPPAVLDEVEQFVTDLRKTMNAYLGEASAAD